MTEFHIEIRDGHDELKYSICGSLPYLDDALKDVVRFIEEVKKTGKFPKKTIIKSLVEEAPGR